MKSFILGASRLQLPLLALRMGDPTWPQVVIIGGTHGDEVEGVALARGLQQSFINAFPYRLAVTVIPELNPDGVLLHTRTNAAGVDLNRNLPTRDWSPVIQNPRYPPGPFANSEPENQALTAYLDNLRPRWILSLHSYHPCLNVNGRCQGVAQHLHRWTGYPVVPSIGYPTPGCLGTYAGIERDWPTLTYEIERGLNLQRMLHLHIPALIDALYLVEQGLEG